MQRKSLLLLISFLLLSSTAEAGVSPSSASWTLYKVNLYTSGDCTGTPEVVFNETAGTALDFVTNPTIGTATVTDGTYNCVAIKLSDTVTFVPSADEGTSCTSGTSYTLDVCDSSWTVTDADSAATSSCTDSADSIWIYISTWSAVTSTSTGSPNSFAPPTSDGDESNGIQLTSALTVAGTTSGVFVIDSYYKVATTATGTDGADECGMGRPTFGFE